jgi:hypothetical protein
MPARFAFQMKMHAAIQLPHFEAAAPRLVGEDLARSQLRRVVIAACDDLRRCDVRFRIEEKASIEVQPGHDIRSIPLAIDVVCPVGYKRDGFAAARGSMIDHRTAAQTSPSRWDLSGSC